LIVEAGITLAKPILAVNDGTVAGRRAVDFAFELSRSLGWEIAVFAAEGMSTSNDVLNKLSGEKSHLIVFPGSLPLSECPSRLKHAVVFIP
jgi:hypothetical protein